MGSRRVSTLWCPPQPWQIDNNGNFHSSSNGPFFLAINFHMVWIRPWSLLLGLEIHFHVNARFLLLWLVWLEQTMAKLLVNNMGSNAGISTRNDSPHWLVSTFHNQTTNGSWGAWLCNDNNIFHNGYDDNYQYKFDWHHKGMCLFPNARIFQRMGIVFQTCDSSGIAALCRMVAIRVDDYSGGNIGNYWTSCSCNFY